MKFQSLEILLAILGFGLLAGAANAQQIETADQGEQAEESILGYSGEFTRSDGVAINIVEADGSLAVVVGDNTFALDPVGDDAFVLVGIGERVTFLRDQTGKITAVRDSQGTYPRAGDVPAEVKQRFAGEAMPPYRYAVPLVAEEGLSPGDAEQLDLSKSALEGIVDDIRKGGEYASFHSLLISRQGRLLLEEYFDDFGLSTPHNLRSATKSVISALAGAAVHRGIVSLDDRPLARIADAGSMEISPHKRELTLAHLLDMRHGLECDDWDPESFGNEAKIYGEADWTSFILSIPDASDARHASYCSAMPLMVGRFLELATGTSLPDFANEALLSPIGVSESAWTWDFELRAKDGEHGGQLHLRPRDMMRFGRLYANGGVADDGRRVLPEGWVSQTFDATMPLGDWRTYNDFWWRYEIEKEDGEIVPVHMASGVGGQRIAIVPSLDMIIITTGGSFAFGRPGPTKVIERVISAATR